VAPDNYFQSINQNDDKLQILDDFFDPRILFVCLDYPQMTELTEDFQATNEEELD
jgi:hypothetical protein